ncbi:MAG: hypothetical protein HQK81_01530 [Desulfovibrionaceae bacterium]|nr:hypothetical protein [Desulfovibrionaceae bacterium]MBF0512730.1 hypothetical protein [Desulfovibrionaceae bacterium]
MARLGRFVAAVGAVLLVLWCAVSALAGAGETLVVRERLGRVDVANLLFNAQFGRPMRTVPIAAAGALDPGFREQLAFYLYFLQGREVDLYLRDGAIVGAGLPGGRPFLGIADGAPVAAAAPQTPEEIAGELTARGERAWRERPEAAAFFEARGLLAGDIGKRPEEIEAGRGVSLAAGGAAVYREKPASLEGTLISADLDSLGRVQAVAGYLASVPGRDMTGYPAARAIAVLIGPADAVSVLCGGELVMRYFVASGGRYLEYSLDLRPSCGRPETGKDYFGFEIVGRIVDVGEAIGNAEAAARR